MRLSTTFAFLALLHAHPVHAGWLHLPKLDKKPVGMQLGYAGTTVWSSKNVVDAPALIGGDLNRSATINVGQSEVVLKFARQSLFQKLSFMTPGMLGKVSLSISPDSKQWTPLGESLLSPSRPFATLDVGRAQGRYVKLSFELSSGGDLRGLEVLGSDSDANYIVMQNREGTGAQLNFASGIGGGRLVYLSDNASDAVADAQFSNHLRFAPLAQGVRTAVYDLGQVRELKEFGSVHTALPVGFSVYAFDQLPEKENWRGRMSFDASVLQNSKPIVAVRDETSAGRVTAKPSKAVKARYIALTWEVGPDAPNFEVLGVSISGTANVFFQNAELTATTYRDVDGHLVTALRSLPEGDANADLGKIAANAEESFDHTPGFAPSGASAGNFAMLFGAPKGGNNGYSSSSGKKDDVVVGDVGVVDPDEDPPGVIIPWCEEASP